MLERGDQVPHFEVHDLEGRRVSYSTIWQRRNLVLVVLPASESESSRRYLVDVARVAFGSNTASVITRDAIAGLPAPAVLVADKWGEIVCVAIAPDIAGLPPSEELLDWISYVEQRCPECEGESK